MMSVGGIVLAAGSSSRMGQLKQLLRLDGKSLVRCAAEAALGGGCQPVVIVTGAGALEVAAELRDLPVKTAMNLEWSKGIGTSIRAGLAALLEDTPGIDAAAVMVCDQYRLDADAVRVLLSAWSAAGKPMAASQYAGTVGTPCCFGRDLFAALGQIADTDGAKKLLTSDPGKVQVVAWPAGADDVDTPEDWHRICKATVQPKIS